LEASNDFDVSEDFVVDFTLFVITRAGAAPAVTRAGAAPAVNRAGITPAVTRAGAAPADT